MPALERASSTTNTTLALHYAAARGCLDCVRLLVDSSQELSANTQMDNDVTPVYLAAQEGHLEVLKFLVLEAGGSLYVRAKDGMAPIHAASQMGCLNCVKWMIQDQGVDPNLRDGDGATPLHFAASRGHLETVRWLLKHGARLSLDKYGKSPINDAAENQQVECLTVLVQHGATPDYKEGTEKKHGSCSCTRKSENFKRGSISSDCSSCKHSSINSANSQNSSNNNNINNNNNSGGQEPFYLHPPLSARSLEAPHAPQDGLYINPMNTHNRRPGSDCSTGSSSQGESFYLHNPGDVIYNRVKDLFETNLNSKQNNGSPGFSALTVKVEVHSSSSGAGSDENLSSSDLSERSTGDHEHDYEDIYLVREESKKRDTIINNGNNNLSQIRSRSRDSGSHSRSASASSSNSGCNVVVKLTPTVNVSTSSGLKDSKKFNEFLPKPQKLEKAQGKKETYSEEDHHSLIIKGNKNLKRTVSGPPETPCVPPPPPFPERKEEMDEPRGAEVVEVVEEPTLKPSEIVKGMCKSMNSLTSAKRLNSSCSDLTIISLNDSDHSDQVAHLVNKQRVLPFIPPSFPGSSDSNNLIKPSEYLRSISDNKRNSARNSLDYEETEIAEKKVEIAPEKVSVQNQGPPPPPLPDFFTKEKDKMVQKESEKNKKQQPLSAISIQDLNSVQLRRTDKLVASKTFSAPTRSMSLQCLQSDNYIAQKSDLIAELKMSKDITGIKKMKIEKAKVDQKVEKEIYTEMTKQFTANNFVEKIPDKDPIGNVIPAWKRQMLAKKAAEKARKELEDQIQRDSEAKRLQMIPQWKRQLIAKKEEAEIRMKQTLYTPKITDEKKVHDMQECLKTTSDEKNDLINKQDLNNNGICNNNNNNNNNSDKDDYDCNEDSNETHIIPWRAQLRKTNSKLNLLE
ncbi:inversin-B-like isoform X2 [Onthophagus taurus]